MFASVDSERFFAYLRRVTALFRLAAQVEGVYLLRLVCSRVRKAQFLHAFLRSKQPCSGRSFQAPMNLFASFSVISKCK